MIRAAKLRTKPRHKKRKPKQQRRIEPLTEFCQSHNFSRAHFYNQLEHMPATMKVGRRRIISTAAIEKWQQERAAAA
jgi:hypothetical protein